MTVRQYWSLILSGWLGVVGLGPYGLQGPNLGNANQGGLNPPFREIGFVQMDGKHSTPRYDHGYVIEFNREVSLSGVPVVVYETAVQRVSTVKVWSKQAKTIWLASASVGTPDHLVLSGRMATMNGATHSFLAFFGALQDEEVTFTWTDPYLPTQVCQAPDGSVWTIGAELPGTQNSVSTESYFVLRHYSGSGKLLQQMIPSSTLHRNLRSAWSQDTQIYLRMSDSVLLLYDGLNRRIYLYDTSVDRLSSWDLARTDEDLSITGVVILGNGDLYATMKNGLSGPESLNALFVMHLPPSSGVATWLAVAGTRGHGLSGALRLLGADGSDLVYDRAPLSQKVIPLLWSSP
jgi:hypothetical protein